MLLFLSFEINAANWTNSDQKFDFDKVEQLPVPNSFPKYSFRAYESCESSKGSKWSNDIEIFLNEDFLWASKHDYHGEWVKIYVGKHSDSGKFIINVSEASKKWKNAPKWMQYVIPNSQPLVDALKSGTIIGKVNEGSSYWRKCSFKINSVGDSNKISIAKFKPIKRQITSLNSVNSRQEIALEKMAKLGLSVGKMYDFPTLISKLESGINTSQNLDENRDVKNDGDKKINEDLLVTVKKGFRTNASYRSCLQKNGISQEQINVMRNRPVAPEALKGFTQASKIQECFQLISSEFKKLEEERKRAEAEAERKKAEEEERKQAEAEAARKKSEEERKRAEAEAEAARKKAAEEERKRAEAEAARKKAEEERKRAEAEAEAARKKAEEEERKRAEAEAARKKAEEEERKRSEAEAARKKAEEKENEEIERSISSFVEAFKMKKALEETIIKEAEDVSKKALKLEEEIQNWIKGNNFQP